MKLNCCEQKTYESTGVCEIMEVCLVLLFECFSLQASDILSNIGSQISLWLGMSIISVFEIVEYLVQLFVVLWSRSIQLGQRTVPLQAK